MFHSRRMLCLERRISEALVTLHKRHVGDGGDDDNDVDEWTVTRVTMNLYRFERRPAPASQVDDHHRRRSHDDEYSNTALMQRLISVIMQDVQQRNLNAKHTVREERGGGGGGVGDDLYVRLNRSCNQRKIVEVCCVIRAAGNDWSVFRRRFDRAVQVRTFDGRTIVYGSIDRKELFAGRVLREFETLPALVFVSCKSLVLIGANGTGLTRIADNDYDDGGGLPLRRHLAYVANFVAYHAFHESDGTFDMRRFGARHRHMRVLLYLLALVNAELFRVNRCANVNLSLNMQSLGKAYDDVGLHVFSENSIQHVRKKNQLCSSRTSGHFVNRCLGRVSELGVNGVTLTRHVYDKAPQRPR